MSLLAAITTSPSVERLQHIPREFWVRMALGVFVIIATVTILRKLAHVNKAVLAVVVGVTLSFIGFNWVYERNEPKWATPAVSFLSGFLPTKGRLSSR